MKKIFLIGIVFLFLISLINAQQGVYNIESGRCENLDTIGFLTICSTGVFDPSKGLCISTPRVEYLCPQNSRYDIAQNICIANIDQVQCTLGIYNQELKVCIYEPELKGQCIQGQWDSEKQACILTNDLDYLCLTGSLVDINGTKICKITPENKYVCLSGFNYNSLSGKCEKIGGFSNEDVSTQQKFNIPKEILYIIGAIIFFIIIRRFL